MNKETYTYSIIGALIFIAVLIGIGVYSNANSSKLDYTPFATCLKDKGATFYGAFWCPHCRAQKDLFGKAAKSLPYNECSTPDGKGMLQECQDKGVQGYPYWVFADGSTKQGEVSLEVLASTTGCVLPVEATSTTQ